MSVRKKKAWEFLFLGTNTDAYATAALSASAQERAASYNTNNVTDKAVTKISSAAPARLPPESVQQGS